MKLDSVETNIVVAEVVRGTRDFWLRELRERNVWAVGFGGNGVRFVTHLDVDDAGIDLALDALRSIEPE